ncbi:MAG: hypothetical protein ACRERD_24695 [Candidatus Binatia bacterium]
MRPASFTPRLQRQGKQSLAGVVLLGALGATPTQAGIIMVDGTACTREHAAMAANAIVYTGGWVLVGAAGNDVFRCFGGRDTALRREGGNGALVGGLGNDTLKGRMGTDVHTGRPGQKSLVFQDRPTLTRRSAAE